MGEWRLSIGMDIGEDGGDANAGTLGAVGIRRRTGGSTSTVSSSGIISSCLERDGLVALPGIKFYIFTIGVGNKYKI